MAQRAFFTLQNAMPFTMGNGGAQRSSYSSNQEYKVMTHDYCLLNNPKAQLKFFLLSN
jgi:hypothetical protein